MEYVHGGDVYTHQGLMDFSVNVNPFGPSEKVLDALEKSVREIGQYPDSQSRRLRKALAEDLKIPEKCLIFGNGAAELIFLLTQAVRPKRAVVTAPAFAEYRQALMAVDCQLIEYTLKEENGFVLKEDYLDLLTDDVDLIFLCSPDNPTGTVIEKELLQNIHKRCVEKQILFVLDECFLDFLTGEPQMRGLTPSPYLFLLRAFTKMHAMPGIRLGYGITSNEELLQNMEEKRQPWSVSCMAQAAGLAAIGQKDRVVMTREYVQKERTWMEDTLTKIGVTFFPSKANYILFKSPFDMFEELKERGFLIRDCSNYPGLTQGFYRIAVKKREQNQALLHAIGEIYENRRR